MQEQQRSANDAGGQPGTVEEKIGVLVVHGVGEQKRFEYLDATVRDIVAALKADPEVTQVGVTARTTRDSPFGAEHETWLANDAAPVVVRVWHRSGAVKELRFHEVWWADLDEPTTLRSQLRFWFWGLAQWAEHRYTKPTQPGDQHFRLPEGASTMTRAQEIGIRLRLYLVAVAFLFILGSFSVINYILRRFLIGKVPGVEILVQYVGDVKLYQQARYVQGGPLSDLGQPPWVAIRRRMVCTLVDMALERYPRWYILAHSLGTVVSWNGLMEPAHRLPNYLDEQRWEKCLAAGIGGTARPDQDAVGPTDEMRPSRPGWLDDNHVIYRDRLFAALHGYLTYGSPLDKFAHLWPRIVAINDDETVFRDGFRWVNVFDPTDPVGGSLDAYNPKVKPSKGQGVARPDNFAFKAFPLLLVSHIRYLTANPKRTDGLVNRVTTWLRHGHFDDPQPGIGSWLDKEQTRRRAWSRYLQWAVLATVCALIGTGILWMVPEWFIPSAIRDSFWERLRLVVAVALILPILAGCCLRLAGSGKRDS